MSSFSLTLGNKAFHRMDFNDRTTLPVGVKSDFRSWAKTHKEEALKVSKMFFLYGAPSINLIFLFQDDPQKCEKWTKTLDPSKYRVIEISKDPLFLELVKNVQEAAFPLIVGPQGEIYNKEAFAKHLFEPSGAAQMAFYRNFEIKEVSYEASEGFKIRGEWEQSKCPDLTPAKPTKQEKYKHLAQKSWKTFSKAYDYVSGALKVVDLYTKKWMILNILWIGVKGFSAGLYYLVNSPLALLGLAIPFIGAAIKKIVEKIAPLWKSKTS